jgi:3-phenylpropionate/cinnamic acid dioxygenase small subunit
MLRYCEDDWKLHRWCTAHYPRWQDGYYEERRDKKKARRSKNKATTTIREDTKIKLEEEVAED